MSPAADTSLLLNAMVFRLQEPRFITELVASMTKPLHLIRRAELTLRRFQRQDILSAASAAHRCAVMLIAVMRISF